MLYCHGGKPWQALSLPFPRIYYLASSNYVVNVLCGDFQSSWLKTEREGDMLGLNAVEGNTNCSWRCK